MRGKVAKRIRNDVYGDLSPREDARQYGKHTTGAVHAHLLRQNYQNAKRFHVVGPEQPEPVRQRNARLKQKARFDQRSTSKRNAKAKRRADAQA